jgi:hypothetical protein
LPAAMAGGAQQQVTRRRFPILQAHRASLPRTGLPVDERSLICG